eukprot:CAMPEP_0169120728 /NCGR_PEP_ID=MMETSP1015-20121227/32267_1 /TAXON_ID=342587 /ORGANISM="Karlodinium micrum, Strain CCMP2283" /LENGTH=107 /DNA_ID=CAMNT_0009183739 /DNA_START=144 /DNA_END=467 /DNA_ORIENTATION=-
MCDDAGENAFCDEAGLSASDVSVSLLQTDMKLHRASAVGRPGDGEFKDLFDQFDDEDELSAGDTISLMQTGITQMRGPHQEFATPIGDFEDEEELLGLQDALRDFGA